MTPHLLHTLVTDADQRREWRRSATIIYQHTFYLWDPVLEESDRIKPIISLFFIMSVDGESIHITLLCGIWRMENSLSSGRSFVLSQDTKNSNRKSALATVPSFLRPKWRLFSRSPRHGDVKYMNFAATVTISTPIIFTIIA